MVEFLSAAWVAALDAAARSSSEVSTDAPFVVEMLVVGPGADAGYQVLFAADGASVVGVGVHPVDVALVTDPETAWALHRGTVRAQDAFARGQLKVRGRPELLSGRAELLTALERAWAPVRAITTPYEGATDAR